MKRLYTNAPGKGNELEELETALQFENCELIAVMDMWWGGSHQQDTRRAGRAGCGLCRRAGREGRAGVLPLVLGKGLIAKSCL